MASIRVDRQPFREAFERSGMTFAEVALACGWMSEQLYRRHSDPNRRIRRWTDQTDEDLSRYEYPDSSRVKKLLYPRVKGGGTPRGIAEHHARQLMDALGLDPVDVGL